MQRTHTFVNASRVDRFTADLDALAASWTALAMTLRLFPTGWLTRACGDDHSDHAQALETSSEQLSLIVKRFRDSRSDFF